MNIKQLEDKKAFINENMHLLPEEVRQNYMTGFAIEYTHNSTAIEGNTLTLMETKVLLEDHLSVGGKNLREIYEVVNHNKAFNYIKKQIGEGRFLDEKVIKDIHEILMADIMQGGIYRNVDVYISGAQNTPPSPVEMYKQIKDFYADLTCKNNQMNVIELSAWTHAEFVKIYPFADGNGRISRLIMNYQLIANGYLAVSIAKEDRLEYFTYLEEYAVNGNLELFAEFIGKLEEKRLDFYVDAIKNILAK